MDHDEGRTRAAVAARCEFVHKRQQLHLCRLRSLRPEEQLSFNLRIEFRDMPHEVFISYSSRDKNAADAVCSVLERHGIRCWIAPRDVMPGSVWSSAIIAAIRECEIMVLVFSGAANASPQIEREVERVINKGLPIIPLRIEDVQPHDSLEYFISAAHWLDAFTPPFENHLNKLVEVIQYILKSKKGVEPAIDDNIKTIAQAAVAAADARTKDPRAEALDETIPARDRNEPSGRSMDPASAVEPRPRTHIPLIAGAALLLSVAAALSVYWLAGFGQSKGPADGSLFTDCSGCPEMIVVPSGTFKMGSPPSEHLLAPADADIEVPVHDVRIARHFAVGRFAVTRDEFLAFARATMLFIGGGCEVWNNGVVVDPTRSFLDPKLSGGAQTGRDPVVCVSWKDATAYAAWLSAQTGQRYRLLSEAEREYIGRAGTSTSFWWGDTISPTQANYWSTQSYNGGPTAPWLDTTVPVDRYKPNAWGLYQVHGNVAEFAADCWHATYRGAPDDGSIWGAANGGDCSKRLVRGGSFANAPALLRSARRGATGIEHGNNLMGFRVARDLR